MWRFNAFVRSLTKPFTRTQCLIPVVMSGIIAVYSLVISVLIAQDLDPKSNYSLFSGFMHLACGVSVGMTGLAAGYCIGVVGDKGVRAYMYQSRIFVGMVLILIFGEVLGLYGYGTPYTPLSLLGLVTDGVQRSTDSSLP